PTQTYSSSNYWVDLVFSPNSFTAASSVSFVRADSTTQGAWKGAYGGDGQAINSDVPAYPAYASVSFTGAESYIWDNPTTNPRALQKGKGTDGIASCWYANTTLTVHANLTDSVQH